MATYIQILFAAFVILLGQPGISLAGISKKVFIIHSYEQGHICGQPQHDGALKALKEQGWEVGKNLEVGVFYMDTKKTNNTPELIDKQAELARAAMEQFKPDVVLTLDDNAFRTTALPYAGKSGSFVFSGLNGQPEKYDMATDFMETRRHPGGNITGVYEKLYIREAINVLAQMHPMNTLLYIGDLSPTGQAITEQVNLELQSQPDQQKLPCLVTKQIATSWEEFVALIDHVNTNPDLGAFYLGALLLKDKNGKTFTASDIINYTLTHAQKPAIGLNYAFIKLGLYGGATVDFYAMGQLAGRKIARILDGTQPGKLPIEDAPRVALVFNLARAEKLGMSIPNDILMAADEVFRK